MKSKISYRHDEIHAHDAFDVSQLRASFLSHSAMRFLSKNPKPVYSQVVEFSETTAKNRSEFALLLFYINQQHHLSNRRPPSQMNRKK